MELTQIGRASIFAMHMNSRYEIICERAWPLLMTQKIASIDGLGYVHPSTACLQPVLLALFLYPPGPSFILDPLSP